MKLHWEGSAQQACFLCSAPIEKSLDVIFDLARPQKGNFASNFVKCVSNVRSRNEKCELLFMKAC